MNLKYFRLMKKALFLVLLYFVCQFVATLPFILWHLVQGTSGSMSLTDPMELSLSVLLSNVLMIAHLLFWKDVRFGMHSFVEVPFRMLLVCVPLVLSAMFVLNAFNEWLDLPNWGEAAFLGMSRNVWGVLAITIGAPLVEELLFRGGVMNSLHRAGYGPRAMILWSALIFGVFHLNPAQIPFAFLLGLLLGWLYYRTGSLLPGILCHFINNSLGVILLRSDHADARLVDLVGGTGPLCVGIALAIIVFACSFFYARRCLKRVNRTFSEQ